MSGDLKILVILPFFYPHRGGSQKYVEDLYETLVEQHPAVHVDILCYNTDHATAFEDYHGLRIFRIPCWSILRGQFVLPKPWSLVSTLVKLAANRYNFVNTHVQFFDPTWWGWLYAKFIGAGSIFTGHSASHPTHQHRLVRVIAWLVDQTLARFSLKFYDLITVENRATGEFFHREFGIKNYHAIYGGVDTNFFQPCDKHNSRRLPKTNFLVTSDQLLITYVGRLIWTKGVTYLYDAIRQLAPAERGRAVFVLAGPGPLEVELKQRIQIDGFTQQVHVLGDLDYPAVQKLLSQTDIFVYPSHHNEGLPITILEAGASGCLVIATHQGGTSEIIQDRQTGLVVQPQNVTDLVCAITLSIQDQTTREKLAHNLHQLVLKQHDQAQISTQLYGLLKTHSF